MSSLEIYNELVSSQNTCHYDLSLIKLIQDKYEFPKYFTEDYYLDYFEDNNIKYKIIDDKAYISSSDISFEILYRLRIESYSALIWYEEIKEFTMNSELYPIKKDWKQDIKNINIKFPAFIKLDTVSCKDIHNGIFDNIDEVIDVFNRSDRIQNTLNQKRLIHKHHYLFVREINKDILEKKGIEFRCFVYHQKLVCISCQKYQDKIKLDQHKHVLINYFKNINLPYTDAIGDIFMDYNNNCTIIEINNFGADSIAGSGNYCWREDYYILHGGVQEVDIRCDSKFSF